jgi:HK97 family phage major capsid protein
MNIAEQVSAFEAKRTTIYGRMTDIMSKASDGGTTLDAAEQEEYDGLEQDVAAVDSHLRRLKTLEGVNASGAKAVEGVKTVESGSAARSGIVVKAPPKLAPGIGFARIVKSYGMAKGNMMAAAQIAEQRYGAESQTASVLKAAVTAGSTLSGSWAEDLVGDETSAFADFVTYLRPMTILGKFGQAGIPALRNVPFRVPLVSQTAGGQGYWVGEGKAKPLTAFDFSRTHLEPLKVANICVLTEEVLRDSSPSAEGIVRDELANALRARLDVDFIDPAKAASANVSPASITNGAAATASSGNDADAVRADVQAVMAVFIAASNAPTSGVWIMSATSALGLSMMMNALGQAEFPGITMAGGTFFGLPVIVSEYIGNVVALVNAADIYLADNGDIAVDLSREASLIMADNPSMDSTTPTPATMVSMFQTNSVAFRAERTINWARRRTASVAYLTGVAWGQAPDAP